MTNQFTLQAALLFNARMFQQGANKAAGAAKSLQGALGKVSSFANNATSSLFTMQMHLAGLQTFVNMALAPAQKLLEVSEKAARQVDISHSFENVAGGAEEATAALQAVQRATRYTTSETEAMDIATTVLTMNLAENSDEIEQVTKYVTVLGKKFRGLSADTALMNYSLMIANKSYARLDTYGLDPTQVRKLAGTYEEAGMESGEAFRKAVMAEMETLYGEIGAGAEMASDAFGQYDAAVENLKTSISELLLPRGTKVAQGATAFARMIGEALEGVTGKEGFYSKEFKSRIAEALQDTAGAEEFAQVMATATERAISGQGALFGLSNEVQDFTQIILQNADSYDEAVLAIEAVNGVLDEFNQKQLGIDFDAIQGIALGTFDARQAEQAAQALEAEREARRAWEAEMTQAAQSYRDVQEQIATEINDIRVQQANETADREIEAARRAEQAVIESLWAQEDAARETAQRRQEITDTYNDAIAKATEQHASQVSNAHASYARQVEDIERDHQRRMQDIQQQYAKSERQAIIDRDADALIQARETRAEQEAEAAQDRQDSMSDAAQGLQEQLTAAEESYNQQRAMAEQNRMESLATLQQELADEERERERAAARQRQLEELEQQWFLEDQQRFFEEQRNARITAHNQELLDAETHYQQLLEQQMTYEQAASLLASQRTYSGRATANSGYPQYASGGYTGAGGMALLHAQEFVLNAQTTKTLEGATNAPLTQENVAALAGGGAGGYQITVPVQATFSGMRAEDIASFRQEMTQVEGSIMHNLARLLEGSY